MVETINKACCIENGRWESMFIFRRIFPFPTLDEDVILGNAFLMEQNENWSFVQDSTTITIAGVTLQNPWLRHKFEVYPVKQSEFCGDCPCEQAFRVWAQRGK